MTARWALAGTPVTNFAAPIEIVIPNPSGEPTLPATSQDGTTWRALELHCPQPGCPESPVFALSYNAARPPRCRVHPDKALAP